LRSLTQRFLEGLAETVEVLNRQPNQTFFNPVVAVFSVLILTGAAAFSLEAKLPLIILTVSIILMFLTRSSFYSWVRVVGFVVGWALVVSIPVMFITPGKALASLPLNFVELRVSWEGLNAMVAFVFRVVAAAAIFTTFALMLGWRGMMKGLEGLRVPREITFSLTLSIIHIPLFLRELAKMLSAREARIVKNMGVKQLWGTLATVIGDLLVKSHERMWRLEKAMRSRSLTPAGILWKNPKTKLKTQDLLLLLLTASILVIGFLVGF